MKYVFLDIDGVLNSMDFFEREKPLDQFKGQDEVDDFALGLAHIGQEYVERLNSLVDPDVAFVLSSTWRAHHRLHHVQTMLAHKGFKGLLIGSTPVTMGQRGREIAMWLEAATSSPMFDVTKRSEWPSFVILDDDSDMLHLESYLVKTSSDVGLQEADIEKAREILDFGS